MPDRGSPAWRRAHWPSCDDVRGVTRIFYSGVRLHVARPAVEAFHALFDCFGRHRYPVNPEKTGVYNCRPVTGGDYLSSHAFAIAGDVNWDTNPYTTSLVTDMPDAMVDEAEGLTTVDGIRIWRWGGDFDANPDTPQRHYDAMHWEIIATPEELRAGVDRQLDSGLPKRFWPWLYPGARGPAARALIVLLPTFDRLGETKSVYDEDVEHVLRAWQHTRGLTVDAIVGPQTWTALAEGMPEIRAGEIGPDKTVRAA